MLEFVLGNKNAVMLEPHRHRADLLAPLERLLHEPSLYDEALRLLARRGFAIPATVLERDLTVPHAFDESVCAAWVGVYADTARHWDLYELAEKLVDLEDAIRQWRFRHATTVERVRCVCAAPLTRVAYFNITDAEQAVACIIIG